MIVTGLTKVKLGDVFGDMKNITLATSSGLIYSWGANLNPDNVDQDDTTSNVSFQRNWGCLDFSIDWDAVRNIAGSVYLSNDNNFPFYFILLVPIMTKFTFRTNGTCLSPR
jgi:hypothetical protein